MQYQFESTSEGYTIFKDGEFFKGAGTIEPVYEKRRRPWQHVRADSRMFYESAKRQCQELNNKES